MSEKSYHYKGFTFCITGDMIGPYIGSGVAWFVGDDRPVTVSPVEASDLLGAYDALVAEVEQYYRENPVPAEA